MVKALFGVLILFILGYACYQGGVSKGLKMAYNDMEEQCVFHQSVVTKDGLVFSCQFQGVIQKEKYHSLRGDGLRTDYEVR